MAAPNMQLRILTTEISQGALKTGPGLVRTCDFFGNWENPCQSLESLSYTVEELQPWSCPNKD